MLLAFVISHLLMRAVITLPEAVYLVVCDPSRNKLCTTQMNRDLCIDLSRLLTACSKKGHTRLKIWPNTTTVYGYGLSGTLIKILKILKIVSISYLVQWKLEYLEKKPCRQGQEQTTLAYPYSSIYSVYRGCFDIFT